MEQIIYIVIYAFIPLFIPLFFFVHTASLHLFLLLKSAYFKSNYALCNEMCCSPTVKYDRQMIIQLMRPLLLQREPNRPGRHMRSIWGTS